MPTATARPASAPAVIETEVVDTPVVLNPIQNDLIARVRAGFPIIWLITDEYARGTLTTEVALQELNKTLAAAGRTELGICYWDLRVGLVRRSDGARFAPPPRQDDSATKQLEFICNLSPSDSVTMIVGLHQLLATFNNPAMLAHIHAYLLQLTCPSATLAEKYVPPSNPPPGMQVVTPGTGNRPPTVNTRPGAAPAAAAPAAPVIQTITALTATDSNRRLIVIGPKPDPVTLPPDIAAYIEFLELVRPTPTDFAREMEDQLTDDDGKALVPYTPEDLETASHELRGLTRFQAQNATMLTMVKDHRLDHKTLRNQVKNIMETHPAITIPEYTEKWEELYGYDLLKEGLDLLLDDSLYSPDDPVQIIPKGVVITGIPGCGKSHLAKAAGGKYNRRTIFVNLGLVFGQYVGQSERQMSELLKALDACSRSIIFIDEFEQAVSGMGGGGNKGDSGVSDRLANQFLTWLNDRVSDNFIIASANDLTKIPPQLLRTGRWDAVYFVDTPRLETRKQIVNLYAGKVKLELPTDLVDDIAGKTEDWAGAELKAMVEYAWRVNRRNPKELEKAFDKALRFVRPLFRQRPEAFNNIRQLGKEIGIPADIDDSVPLNSKPKRGMKALETLST